MTAITEELADSRPSSSLQRIARIVAQYSIFGGPVIGRGNWAHPIQTLLARAILPATIVGAISTAASWPSISDRPLNFVFTTTLSCSIATVAIVIRHLAGERRLSNCLLAMSVFWSGQWIVTWNVSVLPFVGAEINALFYVAATCGLILYPDSLPTARAERTFVVATCGMISAYLLAAVTSTPSEYGFSDNVFWPTIQSAERYHSLSTWAAYGAMLALAFLYVWVIRRHIHRMTGIDAIIIRPLVYSFCFIALISGFAESNEFFPNERPDTFFLVLDISMLSVPFAFLAVILQRHLQHARISATLHKRFNSNAVGISEIEAGLQEALNDASLRVSFTISSSTPNSGNSHLHTFSDDQGSINAVVTGDPSLLSHPALLDTAFSASSLAIDNARLQANLLAKLEEVEDSRQRIFQAMLSERKRIERDLHDGVQQRLLALAMRVGTAQYQNSYEKLLNVEWIRTELLATVDDVRDIARGIHPADLRQSDLKSAIESVAAGLPMSIDVSGDIERLPDPIEATAYFVACEALTNAVKHSGASNASVRLDQTKDTLVLDITDNGRGGAVRIPQGGLNGLTDRVSAVRGQISVTSEISKGTTIRVEIPCV